MRPVRIIQFGEIESDKPKWRKEKDENAQPRAQHVQIQMRKVSGCDYLQSWSRELVQNLVFSNLGKAIKQKQIAKRGTHKMVEYFRNQKERK